MRFENSLPEFDRLCQEKFPGEEKLTLHEAGWVLARTLLREGETCVSLRRVKLLGMVIGRIFDDNGSIVGDDWQYTARGSATVIRLADVAPVISWLCNELAKEPNNLTIEDRQEMLAAFGNLMQALQRQDEQDNWFDDSF